MAHKVHTLNFASLTAESWGSFPGSATLHRQIADAVLAHSEVAAQALGLYAPPKEIRQVRITSAVFDQVACMWHGHRVRGRMAPPFIPLKIFVFGFGQDAKTTWADIEVLPGLDNWEAE